MLPNCPDFVINYFAVMSIGGIVVNTNPMYVEREIEYQMNDSGAKMIITLQDLYSRVKSVQPDTSLERVIVTGFQAEKPKLYENDLWLPELYAKDNGQFPKIDIDLDNNVAVLQYTGGTTGISKGAMLTHKNLYANALQTNEFFVGEDLKRMILSVLPFFHVYGMTCCMNMSIIAGSTMLLVPRFDTEEIIKLIDEYKPTYFPGVPTMYIALNSNSNFKNVANVKVYNTGAAPMPVEVWEEYNKRLAGTASIFSGGYGLSEASPVTHSNPAFRELKSGAYPSKEAEIADVEKAKSRIKVGTIGVPYPDTDSAVVDVETGEKRLGVGEVGVKGPQVMKGYWNMPEETEKALRDGWLYTGDLAVMDEDVILK